MQNGWTRIDYKGWSNVYCFQTPSMQIVVVADVGARIMEYGPIGRNIFWQDPALWGATLRAKGFFMPGGSQFDLLDEKGGENISVKEPCLWIGEYTVELKSPNHLTAVSPVGPTTGLQIVRDIEIDPATGKVVIAQTVQNRSKHRNKVSIWDRTWTVGPCNLDIPVTADAQWPEGWAFIGSKDGELFTSPRSSRAAAAEQFQYADGILTVKPLGTVCQTIMKGTDGWMAYVQDNLIYMKRYSIVPGVYPLANWPVSVWLSDPKFKDHMLMVELEPTSPVYDLAPGQTCRFQEEWQLYLLDAAQEKERQANKKAFYKTLA